MPITGMRARSVMADAVAGATHSSSSRSAPASSSSRAARASESASRFFWPCTRGAPNFTRLCGRSPRCAHTGRPFSASTATISTCSTPASSLTMCAPPSCISAAVLSSAVGTSRKLMNGRSAISSARRTPRATQPVW